MAQTPLDELRAQVAAEQDPSPRRRRYFLISLIFLFVGIILGYLAYALLLVPPSPQVLELSRAEQDDYILMIAEAYATDRNSLLAQQRLARLNDPRTTERIIALAQEYAPQQDYVAQRLALLAVAAGSKDKTLVALAATVVAPTLTPTFTPTSPPPTNTPRPTNTLAPNYVVVTSVPTETPTIYYIVVTGVPTQTPLPTWTPTPLVSTEDERPEVIVPMPANLVAQRVTLNVPVHANFPSAEIRLAARPKNCTPADQMPAPVSETILLCAGQTYAPFEIQGNNLTVYGDPERTALIKGEPRRFAVTVQGTNISIVGVHVEGATHDDDMNDWLCLYPNCFHTPDIGGAQGYGGGILLKNTSNAAVLDSQFNTGTTGIFSYKGFSNKIFRNAFSDLNGWGVMLMQTRNEYVVANTFRRINRACDGLDNVYHANGCESSGLVMTKVNNTLVYENNCRRVSNCYYANGDGGYGSANIKFYNNQCAGAKNNCFEVTFGLGHEFDYNTAVFDAENNEHCDYPFWIGGSTAYFGPNNQWNCLRDFDTALNDARTKTTNQSTEVRALTERPAPTQTFTPTRFAQGGAQPAVAKPTQQK